MVVGDVLDEASDFLTHPTRREVKDVTPVSVGDAGSRPLPKLILRTNEVDSRGTV